MNSIRFSIMENKLPLQELSISHIYLGTHEPITYVIPIYQRNYAWEDDQISALIKDVYDTFHKSSANPYFIGTLVTYKRDDNLYEVIDGQQRLTTIYIILKALGLGELTNKLTYSARKSSASTIKNLKKYPNLGTDIDRGIENGYKYAQKALEMIDKNDMDGFKNYLLSQVKIIHYQVPKDVDLNHYFEVMNSRGEQLEKHEIVKSMLSQHLTQEDQSKFSRVWEACSEMNMYIQQIMSDMDIFGPNRNQFTIHGFDEIPTIDKNDGQRTILELLSEPITKINEVSEKEMIDKFQPIIDFPNFLLTVLKITRLVKEDIHPIDFILDDKELLNEFDKVLKAEEDKAEFVKRFAYNLLKAKFYLDNYIVHHTMSNKELAGENPWKLQYYYKEGKNQYPKNIADTEQDELVHLLSMFEVSFTPKQRKNYLCYCLLYLFNKGVESMEKYLEFMQNLAKWYFYGIYMDINRLNERNLPKPNAFDDAILKDWQNNMSAKSFVDSDQKTEFLRIYCQGHSNIPLFVFNYTDYILWKRYAATLRGNVTKKGDSKRKAFFETLGCSDFELDTFNNFYFSRTRKSLEHYYPSAKAIEGTNLSLYNINCFGNFAMIGSEANSSGSNWSPRAKLEHYKDRKSDQVSVASLKFKIMMQKCQDNYLAETRQTDFEWNYEDMMEHQRKMLEIIFGDTL